jgi:hypothetical protein
VSKERVCVVGCARLERLAVFAAPRMSKETQQRDQLSQKIPTNKAPQRGLTWPLQTNKAASPSGA